VAKRSPEGGPHEASNGGMGIGPEDVLSRLSQPSQESVPVRATVLPTKANSAAQVKGSRSSVKEDTRTVGSRVVETSTRSVYVNGGSRVPFLSYSPNVREGTFDELRCEGVLGSSSAAPLLAEKPPYNTSRPTVLKRP
jgi:hypothetical protein